MRLRKSGKIIGIKVVAALTAAGLLLAPFSVSLPVCANTDFRGELESVASAVADGTNHNVVYVNFNNSAVTAKITFLENNIFRYNVDPSGAFGKYAAPRSQDHTARIQQYPDESEQYTHPRASVSETDENVVITSGDTTIQFDKSTAAMTVLYKGRTVMQEQDGLIINDNTTVQTIVKKDGEHFFGGGTQNGRFIHTGETIRIVNENRWEHENVSSPNPFYYTTTGYGILRNTFAQGNYDFGDNNPDTVRTVHNESEYDAYYFLSDGADGTAVVQDILQGYFKVTGNPVLLPEYGFYEGHLNCYNRDSWSDTGSQGSKEWNWKGSASSSAAGTSMYESGMSSNYRLTEGLMSESLNGEKPTVHVDRFPSDVTTPEKYSARAVLDDYETYDMPFGYFLPNDGYGCGYGQNGYRRTGGVNTDGSSSAERTAAIDANVENLKKFTEYAQDKGVETGLWTQSNLTPDANASTEWHLLRDFQKEVRVGGITTLKTDVAWVGAGYSFGLNGVKFAYDTIVEELEYRPNIISLDGWAGSQRFMSVWTGDQYGGNWEYIRFHIPTYIGQSLSGNPNIGSDMDGIFGGNSIIATRDTQWKAFTPQMLNMDGWGSYAKTPYTFGDPYTGIARMYLKLKARLMPYIYTNAASAANIDTGNEDRGLPMIRAMFLEYPEESQNHTYNETAMQYQYMLGESLLVAPVYTETAARQENGNDVRNGIYLPDENQIWIDYFTGEQYRGGQTLNSFDTPIWKLPVFVKNGAIIPMYNENNNPAQIDRSQRFIEFWPAGTSSYTVYEDDGKYVTNHAVNDGDYGIIDQISYGDHVTTTYESVVEGDTATLTSKTSTGGYTGYDRIKKTTFIVNVSREPDSVTAKNGDSVLTVEKVSTKAEFEARTPEAGKAVSFYDASPSIETYAPESETQIAAMVEGVTASPKLYVKFAETDSQTNAQTLILGGFANIGNLSENTWNSSLAVPAGLEAPDTDKTPTSIRLTWNPVADATGYEIMVDGILNSVGETTEFEHVDLEYNSSHTYKVRARNANGYSEWSAELTTASKEDPWRNVPDMELSFTGGDTWGAISNATDHNFETMFHSAEGNVVSGEIPVIIDLGAAYELDRFEYYPRSNFGNGLVTGLDVYTSLDGVHWVQRQDGTEAPWTYNTNNTVQENVKTVTFADTGARYVKLVTKESTGGFFSCNELAVYKKDGSRAFAVGSTNRNASVLDGDYTNMANYLGTSVRDGANFVDQIQRRYGDINNNDVYDVYDYAFTMFQLDGGTAKTGAVAGNLFLIPSAENVGAEQTFEISIYADSVSNLNAFGHVLPYDPAKVEFVSISKSSRIPDMEDMNVNKIYEDGTAYYNLAYANRGNKEVFNGSGILATITMRAKQDISTADPAVIDLRLADLIGPDFSLVTTDSSQTPAPEILPEISREKISAEAPYSENNTADKAFDGDLITYWESPYGGADANLPKDLVITLSSPHMIGRVDFISHTARNGGITDYDIHLSENGNEWIHVKSGTVDAASYLEGGNVIISSRFDQTVRAKYIKLTAKASVGRIESENNKYARIAEIVLYGTEAGASVTADKSTLQALVNENKDRIQRNYTDISWKAFREALEAAQAVLAREEAAQAEVDRAESTLQAAVDGLKEQTVEKPFPFTDVNKIEGNWKYESVKYVYNRDIMNGISGTTEFRPDQPLTRGMFATVLYRMAGEPKVVFTNRFRDVAEGKWYSSAIIWANEQKIVSGYTNGSYGVNDNITREQIAKMLKEYAKVCKYDISAKKNLSTFTDAAEVSGWAIEYLQWAAAVEMITGKPNEDGKTYRLDPKGEATRAECSAMLMRFAKKYTD